MIRSILPRRARRLQNLRFSLSTPNVTELNHICAKLDLDVPVKHGRENRISTASPAQAAESWTSLLDRLILDPHLNSTKTTVKTNPVRAIL